MKFILYFFVLVLAAAIGFVVHVIEAEWLRAWISQQMTGKSVMPSWDVRYVAMALAIESSIGVFIVYLLLRQKIGNCSLLIQVGALSGIILAMKSMLIRQPVMDFIIGNPIHVVAAQNLLKWMTPILMSTIIVVGYFLIERFFVNSGLRIRK
ncbi:hypothetical protein [Vibrio penaeicida]|uniref:DUF2269 family protein n=1 Tax=Vibrio penaeicida TaxID=104609 RepID=A0AAV5NZV8_9VIBR|nr:hypothetical protein [Vibrio penaeicida]GLQ76108.1 hypothetical protein GCM10007932_54710 [Vibrio penaeicida]